MNDIWLAIAIREYVLQTIPLSDFMTDLIEREPRLQLIAPGTQSSGRYFHIESLDPDLDISDIRNTLLYVISDRFREMNTDDFLDHLKITEDQAVLIIQNADPTIFFSAENSLRRSGNRMVYYVEHAS